MRARLVGLVLIPTLALMFFGGQGALQRRNVADRADHLAREVDLSVTTLNTAIFASDEQRLTAAATSGQEFGVSIDQTSALLGFQVTETLLLVRQEADRDAGLHGLLAGRGGPDELARIRGLVDSGSGRAEVERYYGALTEAAQRRWSTETQHLTTSSSETPQTPGLSHSIRSLEGGAALYQIASEQLGSSADTVLPGITGSSSKERDVRLLTALYQEQLQRLTIIQGEQPSGSFRAVAGYDAYDVALDRLLAGRATGGELDIAGLGETFRAGLAREDLLRALLASTADQAHAEAVEVGARARTEYQQFLLALVVLSLASIALALGVASSIVRPWRGWSGAPSICRTAG